MKAQISVGMVRNWPDQAKWPSFYRCVPADSTGNL